MYKHTYTYVQMCKEYKQRCIGIDTDVDADIDAGTCM